MIYPPLVESTYSQLLTLEQYLKLPSSQRSRVVSTTPLLRGGLLVKMRRGDTPPFFYPVW